jgi:CubicO group peptidase (beta-lactamase class C family)
VCTRHIRKSAWLRLLSWSIKLIYRCHAGGLQQHFGRALGWFETGAASTRESASDEIMMRRRDVPLAAAAQGLAIWSGSAFAQSKGHDKKESAFAAAPVQPDERVKKILAPIRDEHHLPGLVGAVLTGNRLAAIGALGVRKNGAPNSMLVTDQIHIGSCTKAMTATMIGTLIDEGKLSSEITVRQVFPSVAPKLHAEFQGVTLWQLMTHRAGLPDNGPWWQLSGKTATEKRRDLLVRMMGEAPKSRPGSTFEYSNVGYALAGLMAEQVTGEPWETLMRRRLFEPLGMDSAGFGSPGHPGQVDQPWGHHPSGKESKPTQQDNAPPLGPAGTVHCTMADWARFAAAHLRGAQGKSHLLKPATFRALHTPPKGGDYAAGWIVTERSWAGGRALTHSGSNTSWYATVWIAPVRDFAILVATNLGGNSAAKACDQSIGKLLESVASFTREQGKKT